MAKHARKIDQAMMRRLSTHKGTGPSSKHSGKRPGSQNRKKCGFGKGGR